MDLLNDLDPWCWAAAIVAFVVASSITFLNVRDWHDHSKIEVEGQIQLAVWLGIAFIFGAVSSYSPHARSPRKTVDGVVQFVGQLRGKNSYTEFICATSCQLTGGYALALDSQAAHVARIGSSYRFTYLEHPQGNAFSGVSLEVIQIIEPDSGRKLYALDLTNHPYRIVAYLFDVVLMFLASFIAVRMMRAQRGRSDEGDAAEASEDEEPSDSSSRYLDLGS
jgi:hypothetical protein